MANNLSLEKKTLVLNSLVEGNSIRSTVRLTGVNKKTVMRLLIEAGNKASEILDREIVNIQSRFVQCDEIWCYVSKKQKQCTEEEKRIGEVGDQYIFVAMDSDSKLIISHLIGKRTMENARSIMNDLNYRIPIRFQLSTDAFSGYSDAVDSVFGTEIDYGTVHKNYAEERKTEKRYSPAYITSVSLAVIEGNPIRKRISTSHIERQNLTMRMSMRRLTRLTNAFSKKLINLKATVALHFYHYNFMRIHQSLRVTPAMQANVTHRLWTWEDLLFSTQMKKAA
ncbi:MAG: IS1 family transposase [Bacteroidota bacterium]|jgi:IS1 family transposase